MNDDEKTELKRRLIEACRIRVHNTAESSKKAMEESQKSANEYGPPKDRYDSFRAQLLTKKDMFARQYEQALDQLTSLDLIDLNKTFDKVAFGAVVITGNQKMIVATGCGKVEVDNDTYFAISPHVPIFQAINGMKKGDSIMFRGQKISIIDIF